MPNYTGNPAAVAITPDLGQNPGATPIFDLPADGEVADAASVNQAFQVTANHLAWLYGPRGVAADYATPVMPFRNSRGQIIERVDAFGMLSGPNHILMEDWSTVIREHDSTYISGIDYQPVFGKVAGGTSTVSDINPAWCYSILNASSYTAGPIISNYGPMLNASNRLVCGRSVYLQPAPNEVGGYASVARVTGAWAFAPNICASLEFTVPFIASDGVSCAGWWKVADKMDPEQLDGIYFKCDCSAGASNWKLITRGSVATGATETDTGVLAQADNSFPTHFRLVYVGAEIDAASTARVLAFVNGVLKANITSPLPPVGFVPRIGAGCKTAVPSIIFPSSQMYFGDVIERRFHLS